MTLVLSTDMEMRVEGVPMGPEMTLLEDNNSPERIVGNAMLEAKDYGIHLPVTQDSTLQDIAAMVVDAYEEHEAWDLASYWRSNFIVFGLL